jgi:hypothetical protein
MLCADTLIAYYCRYRSSTSEWYCDFNDTIGGQEVKKRVRRASLAPSPSSIAFQVLQRFRFACRGDSEGARKRRRLRLLQNMMKRRFFIQIFLDRGTTSVSGMATRRELSYPCDRPDAYTGVQELFIRELSASPWSRLPVSHIESFRLEHACGIVRKAAMRKPRPTRPEDQAWGKPMLHPWRHMANPVASGL